MLSACVLSARLHHSRRLCVSQHRQQSGKASHERAQHANKGLLVFNPRRFTNFWPGFIPGDCPSRKGLKGLKNQRCRLALRGISRLNRGLLRFSANTTMERFPFSVTPFGRFPVPSQVGWCFWFPVPGAFFRAQALLQAEAAAGSGGDLPRARGAGARGAGGRVGSAVRTEMIRFPFWVEMKIWRVVGRKLAQRSDSFVFGKGRPRTTITSRKAR